MSTDVKTSQASGEKSPECLPHNLDPKSLKYLNHKFDDVLAKTSGEVQVVMRICDNEFLLEKILNMLKGLSEHIKNSLDQI